MAQSPHGAKRPRVDNMENSLLVLGLRTDENSILVIIRVYAVTRGHSRRHQLPKNGDASLGQILDASITFKARFLTLLYMPDQQREAQLSVTIEQPESDNIPHPLVTSQFWLDNEQFEYTGQKLEAAGYMLYFIALYRNSNKIAGLVLEESSSGSFKRIGWMSITHEDEYYDPTEGDEAGDFLGWRMEFYPMKTVRII